MAVARLLFFRKLYCRKDFSTTDSVFQIFISCLILKLYNLNHIYLAAAKAESFGRPWHDYYFCAGNKKQRPVSYFLPHANSFLRLKLGHIPHIHLSVHMSIMDRGFMANQSLLLLHSGNSKKYLFTGYKNCETCTVV